MYEQFSFVVAQCSHASVELAQARPDNMYMSSLKPYYCCTVHTCSIGRVIQRQQYF